MDKAFLPILVIPTHAARRALGADVGKVAVLAAKAIFRNRRGLEIAHQQIRFGDHDLAFCSRIGAQGDLILELDVYLNLTLEIRGSETGSCLKRN
jgi:hypothetical protein